MKKFLFTLLFSLFIFSCSDKMYVQHIKDYDKRITLVKSNFLEVYNLYKNGEVIIDDVYEYVSRKDSIDKVGIKYHYRLR